MQQIIKLDELQNGELMAQINYELEKIFNNIKDPNADLRATRSLTISLKFKPVDEDLVKMIPNLKTTIAPIETSDTTLLVDKDIKTGKIVASEYNKQVRGQMHMKDLDNEDSKEDKKVLDLRTVGGK